MKWLRLQSVCVATTVCVIVIPCFWTRLVTPADLQSHLYNAWLSQLAREGKAPGIWIASQTTNVLVDWVLAWAVPALGVSAAERLVTSVLVSVFFWGALRYVSRGSGAIVWELAPWLAMFCYGFVFQTGLLNFFASAGCVMWIMAGAAPRSALRVAGSGLLLAIACVAHPLPVVWGIGLGAYELIAARLRPRWQWVGLGAALVSLALLRSLVGARYLTRWSPNQLALATGADQVLTYGRQYLPVFAACLALFAALAVLRWRMDRFAGGWIPVHLYVLSAAATVILPNAFRPDEQAAWSGVICQRLSLLTAVLLLAALASGAAGRRVVAYAGLVTASGFFALLYRDVAAAGRVEAKIAALVSTLPPGGHVISYLPQLASPHARVYYGDHLVARACIERCFDYQNYEPATGQFRVRAHPGSTSATADVAASYGMEVGMYRVTPTDPALHLIHRCGPLATDVCMKPIQAGQRGLDFVK